MEKINDFKMYFNNRLYNISELMKSKIWSDIPDSQIINNMIRCGHIRLTSGQILLHQKECVMISASLEPILGGSTNISSP